MCEATCLDVPVGDRYVSFGQADSQSDRLTAGEVSVWGS